MTAPTATELTALDAAYRAAVARTSLAVAQTLYRTWADVDVTNLAATSGQWLAQAVGFILAGQRQAVQYGNLYTDQVRRLVVPDARPWTPPPPRPPNAEQVRTSIEFLAIKQTAREMYALQQSIGEAPEDRDAAQRTVEGRAHQLAEEAIKRAAGGAIRYVTTAGKDQVVDNVQSDRVALGWVRTTRPGCCAFCAMLASRGRVYKRESFERANSLFEGVGAQKVHDNCGCGLRPIYTDADELPEQTADFEQLWIESTRGFSGKDAINAFRRAYEARQRQ